MNDIDARARMLALQWANRFQLVEAATAFREALTWAAEGAIADRDQKWREAIMLWSGGSGPKTDDEYGAPLRVLMEGE